MIWAGIVASSSTCAAARAHYEGLAFEAALAATAADTPLPPACAEVRGLVLLALGRRGEAEAVFRRLFERHPRHPVDVRALAPSDRSFIDRVRAQAEPMALDVSAGWLVHTTVRLEVRVKGGLQGAARVRFEGSVAGSPASGVVDLVGRVATTTVTVAPGAFTEPLALMVTVEAGSGRKVYAQQVVRPLPARPPPPPIRTVQAESDGVPWWVWTLIGVGVVGAVVTTVVVVQPDDPDADGTLGRIRVP